MKDYLYVKEMNLYFLKQRKGDKPFVARKKSTKEKSVAVDGLNLISSDDFYEYFDHDDGKVTVGHSGTTAEIYEEPGSKLTIVTTDRLPLSVEPMEYNQTKIGNYALLLTKGRVVTLTFNVNAFKGNEFSVIDAILGIIAKEKFKDLLSHLVNEETVPGTLMALSMCLDIIETYKATTSLDGDFNLNHLKDPAFKSYFMSNWVVMDMMEQLDGEYNSKDVNPADSALRTQFGHTNRIKRCKWVFSKDKPKCHFSITESSHHYPKVHFVGYKRLEKDLIDNELKPLIEEIKSHNPKKSIRPNSSMNYVIRLNLTPANRAYVDFLLHRAMEDNPIDLTLVWSQTLITVAITH